VNLCWGAPLLSSMTWVLKVHCGQGVEGKSGGRGRASGRQVR
jgi:hypothetical protein